MRAATVEGSPKTPLPMMEFTTSATRLQRPMARTRSWAGLLEEDGSIRVFVPYTEEDWTTAATVFTWAMVTFEQAASALLAAPESLVRRSNLRARAVIGCADE